MEAIALVKISPESCSGQKWEQSSLQKDQCKILLGHFLGPERCDHVNPA